MVTPCNSYVAAFLHPAMRRMLMRCERRCQIIFPKTKQSSVLDFGRDLLARVFFGRFFQIVRYPGIE